MFTSSSKTPSPSSSDPNIVQPAPKNFLDWTNNHPLVILVGTPDLPFVAFKVLPKYEGMGKTLYEHGQDVAHPTLSFNITNMVVMTRLLSLSFEEKFC